MSYHGIQLSGTALILYAIFALLQGGGSLSDTAVPFVFFGVLVVFAGAVANPLLEKRLAWSSH